ncbi:MAG: hypothetical protein JW889_13575 [Verrucomicrobia bacterium]|nr:hypothetical protein [Verrucomicrobiota bacterium]
MVLTRQLGWFCTFGLAMFLGCGGTDSTESIGLVSSASQEAKCGQAVPHDILIAELMHFSVQESFSLTHLYADASGDIVADIPMTQLVEGQVGLINTVPEARAALAQGLDKVSGLPPYTIAEWGWHEAACTDLLAWSLPEPVVTNTDSYYVVPGENPDSWTTAHKEVGKVCPLVKRVANQDVYDPPNDGSTNLPPSSTVSGSGVKANAFGLCPTGTVTSTWCKLSYAVGINWNKARWCQAYYGNQRCVLK